MTIHYMEGTQMTTQTKNDKAPWSLGKVKNTVNAIVAGVTAAIITTIGVQELDNGYLGFGLLVMCFGLFTIALVYAHLAVSEVPA